jgi:hypothetical protein
VGHLHFFSKVPERGTLRTPRPVESGQMHHRTSSWPQRSKSLKVLTKLNDRSLLSLERKVDAMMSMWKSTGRPEARYSVRR